MATSPFLPLPAGVDIASCTAADGWLIVQVIATALTSECPRCHHLATRTHSHYTRTLQDLPCGGQKVRLIMKVRRFFCDAPHCPQKVFTERLPTLVQPWARMTNRLVEAVQSIGLATCGEGGARLAERLQVATSPTTILRRVMERPTPAAGAVVALGIDDFAFRRHHHFGTILVDLDHHMIVDLLPERSAASSAAWMREHPEIDYVSRDRGTEYAAGAREGVPQAMQIADRFHLMKNLVEAIAPIVARCWKTLRQQGRDPQEDENPISVSPDLAPIGAPEDEDPWVPWRPAPGHHDYAPIRLANQAHKQHLFDQVLALQQSDAAYSYREIAQYLGLSVRTVSRWMSQGACPGKDRRKRRSEFDQYAGYVLRRWKQGCHEVKVLWQEITRQGFQGSLRTVYQYIHPLKTGEHPLAPVPESMGAEADPVEPSLLETITWQKALWHLVHREEELDQHEREEVRTICALSEPLKQLYGLIQAFRDILRYREGHRLAEWVSQVHASDFGELKRFAKGLDHDREAVLAGLTHNYSNGMVEGFVNKVKMVKRVMFGKAGFPLLRQRVLHAL